MGLYHKKLSKRGDTLIEVMLALSVLTLLLMTAWSLTNRATQISTAARIRTNMVNELKSQAEVLKAQHSLSGFAAGMAGRPSIDEVSIQPNPCSYFDEDTPMADPSNHPPDSFYYDASGAIEGGSKVVGGNANSRIWVQKVTNTIDGFIDFYVQGCWMTSGGINNLDNSIFVVRRNI